MVTLAASGGVLRLPDGIPRIVVIADTSDSATAAQAAVRELVSNVLRQLPAAAGRSVHFLGSPATYNAAGFLKDGTRWMRDNAGRLSVISPVWAQYKGDEHSTFVVVGSGPIYDLADWEGSELLARTYFVSVGDSMSDSVTAVDEVTSPSVSDLLSLILDPITEVSISGRGFLPTWWDNDGYSLRVSDGATLVSSPDLSVFSIEIAYLVADSENAVAQITRRSGRITTERLELSMPPPAPVADALPADEAELWRLIVRGQAVACPVCGEVHVVRNVRCRADLGSVKTHVLSTLASVKDRFVLLSQRGREVLVTVMPRAVLLLPGNRALVREKYGTAVVEFDSYRGWRRVTDASNYHEVETGTHALYV